MPALRRNPARDIIDTATQLRIAVAAGAHPKTVDRVLLGLPVRGQVGTRVLAVLLECGIIPELPPEENDANNKGVAAP